MQNAKNPHRILIRDYLSVTRRISELVDDHSKQTRETAENLICKGL
ncbi:MAG: hypothetical protein M0Z55_01745 [Peptococcaceae bacterium]|nr:hypothetical protein [Peptococcaceae bacterium]